MQSLSNTLKVLIPPTRKLLLYNNWSDTDDFEMQLNRTGLTIDELLETKCSTTRDAIAYLFNFIPSDDHKLDKAINVTLQGYIGERLSNTGHVLTIIPYYNLFLLIDSYYDCHGLVIHNISEDKVLSLLTKLQQLTDQFIPTLWQEITGCPYKLDGTEYITSEISYNDFDIDHVKQRFRDLVQEIIDKLTIATIIEKEHTLSEIMRDRQLRLKYNNLSDDKIMYLLSDEISNVEEILEWLNKLLL